ncbi:MAG: hypothetical protein M1436_02555 [Acidobacteria bacterium]|nr:hypothetical protein [Acidobacteriota bacterium]
MFPRIALLLLVAFGTSARAQAPVYSAESIANWATNRPGPYAPNSIVSLYGKNLSYREQSAAITDNRLPNTLAGVRVLWGLQPVPLYYVGPTQINFILPASMDPGEAELRVVREGTAGPVVKIVVDETAPALLQDGEITRAMHADWSPITADHPAGPGEIVVLFATGLGPATLRLEDGEVPPVQYYDLATLVLKKIMDFRVMLAGVALPPERILYAGMVPGTAGLYQVNVQLPDPLPGPDPDIQVAMGERSSPVLKLPARPAED